MRNKTYFFIALSVLVSTLCYSQTTLKEYKAGHVFNISIPDYMTKTIGLNDAAIFQFKSEVKDVYGFVIEDNKEDLSLADFHFTSINEFYDDFIKDFLVDEPKRKVSKVKTQKIGEINFIESDLTYYDAEYEGEIYYLVGIVETKDAFYKVLSWSSAKNKDKFKADFQKILYSLND